MTSPWSRAIVVGASSGIGEALARSLAGDGVSVALIARRKDALERICTEINRQAGEERALSFEHDVRKTEDIVELFQRVTTALGGVDLVIYAAGVMYVPAADEYPTSADRDEIETNFTGAVAWLNEAAARFSRAGTGAIIGISSVAGDRGRTIMPTYHATKAALDTYLESLRARLGRRGVTVMTAKPGFVRTGLTENSGLPGVLVMPADEAARQILRAAAAGKRVAYIPPWWRPIMWLVRAIPAPIFERLNF